MSPNSQKGVNREALFQVVALEDLADGTQLRLRWRVCLLFCKFPRLSRCDPPSLDILKRAKTTTSGDGNASLLR